MMNFYLDIILFNYNHKNLNSYKYSHSAVSCLIGIRDRTWHRRNL